MVPGSFIGKKEGWGAQENKRRRGKGKAEKKYVTSKEYVSC